MKWALVLICLLGLSFAVENETLLESDQDNFSWVSQIFRPDQRQDCDCECGKSRLERENFPENNRIVGGKEARKHGFPWMVALMFRGQIYCGGSVINDKFILSAAHCHVVPPKDVIARIGAHDVRKDKKGDYSDHRIKRVHVHERYNNKTYHNDIALYELAKRLDFSDRGPKTIVPICMPKKSFNGMATVIGWGRVQYAGNPSPYLRQVNVPIVPLKECRRVYGAKRITDQMICAGYKEGMRDACEGDSGGPLFFHESGIAYQAGVVSFGMICAYPEQYGVYSRVTSYKNWIESKTAGTCSCSDSDSDSE